MNHIEELMVLNKQLDTVVAAKGVQSDEAQDIMDKMDAVWIVMSEDERDLVEESGWFYESGTHWGNIAWVAVPL